MWGDCLKLPWFPWETYGGLLSHGGTPKSSKISKSFDHDFVLKPMVTWGSPIFRTPRKNYYEDTKHQISHIIFKRTHMERGELQYTFDFLVFWAIAMRSEDESSHGFSQYYRMVSMSSQCSLLQSVSEGNNICWYEPRWKDSLYTCIGRYSSIHW